MLAPFCRVVLPICTLLAAEYGFPMHGSDREGSESYLVSCDTNTRTRDPRDCLNAALAPIWMTISHYRQWQAGVVAAARETENEKVGAAAVATILAGAVDAAMLLLTAEQRGGR
jgi:hypothetical protein